jgi:hypothetical protein
MTVRNQLESLSAIAGIRNRETWPIRSRGFRNWLVRSYYEAKGDAPNSQAIQSAMNLIIAQAQFDGPERKVQVRVGGCDGRLYLDLCDVDWRAVEIDANGWRVTDNPPVRFQRAAGMLPLPMPVRGGAVETLRPFLNVRSDAEFTLAVAWALAAMRDNGPYPVLAVVGEHGTAKTSFVRTLKDLIDPNSARLRALPREDRDLFIAAVNSHVLAFDNISGLPAWISDTLCRLATGGGFATRELYTDTDEVLFDATRPIALNGIDDVVTRPDLADRAIMLTLEPIDEEKRKTERDLKAEFDAAHPAILGVLLDAVSHGLRTLPGLKLNCLPRMADFAMWATACEGVLNLSCSFKEAYDTNLAAAMETVIAADPVAETVRAMMAELRESEWQGTASQLLSRLTEKAGGSTIRDKHWPGAPHVLSRRLRRAATFLRKTGIDIDIGGREGRDSAKIIRITRPAKAPEARRPAQPGEELPF